MPAMIQKGESELHKHAESSEDKEKIADALFLSMCEVEPKDVK